MSFNNELPDIMFEGSGVAMITPFTESGVNYDALAKIIDHIIDGGTNALFVLGTTGEPCTMTESEREQVVGFTVKRVNKKIPVFAGSGGNNTAEVVSLSKRYEAFGADGLLIVTPYYNKCTQNGLVAHYKAVSDAVNIPIIVYNVPARTGFNIEPATYVKLCALKNVRGIKEASGNIGQITDTLRIVEGKVNLYSGDDALTVPAMAMGAKGIISVAGNVIPQTVNNIAKLCFDGKIAEAGRIQQSIAPFVKALFAEVNPIPCKKAMQLAGFDAGIPRLPLTELEPEHTGTLRREMEKLGLIKT